MNDSSKITTQITLIGLMTAVMCIIAPFSFMVPASPVPISLGTLTIYFSVFILGMKRGVISILLYILLGFIGLPVFSGFTGGIGKLFGPTGGYILGYVFLGVILGFFLKQWPDNLFVNVVGMILGTAVCYFFGTLWLAYQTSLNFSAALWAGVIPYLAGDVIKIIIAAIAGRQIRKRLLKANLL